MFHKRHRDQQFLDEVLIQTVPRFKESEISGNEWRYSAIVTCKYKGVEVLKFSMLDVKAALEHANTMIMLKSESGEVDTTDREEVIKHSCDQEGCKEKARNYYQLKKLYNRDGSTVDTRGRTYFSKFCDLHGYRGGCGLEDANHNHIIIDNPYKEE